MSTSPTPVPFIMDTITNSGMHLWGESASVDIDFESRALVQGAPILKLEVVSEDCHDVDIHARLSLVEPNGDIVQLTEGRLRLSHRNVDENTSKYLQNGEIEYVHHHHSDPQPLDLQAPNEALIQFLPTSFVVKPGARLRLGFSACRADGILRPAELQLTNQSALLLPELTKERRATEVD